MKNLDLIEIRKVTVSSANSISKLFDNEEKDYIKYFHPFNLNQNSIALVLQNAILDQYFGLFISDQLVGLYMLRGLDEGYSTPSYGVMISQKFSNLGLSKLSLQHAISFCKINDIKKIMLKVHPQNIVAKAIYESFGFIKHGIDAKNKNIVFYKNVKR